MIQIKICGLTNADDAWQAVEAGADALGLIGVSETPRYVSPVQFRTITARVPVSVPRIIVVRQPEDATDYDAEGVQYYSDGSPDASPTASHIRRIRAFRIRNASSLQELRHYPYPVDAVLLDAYHAEKLGGSGVRFDWTLAAQARAFTDRPILLAGGLTPENVSAALDAVQPDGVDVSSGIESSPGIKDLDKLRAFVQAVRAWEQRNLQKQIDGATISHA